MTLLEQSGLHISGFGSMTLTASPKGLVSLKIGTRTVQAKAKNPHLKKAIQQLQEYFAGKRQRFEVPLDLQSGTPFQRKVWQALRSLNYGTHTSYQDLANKVRHPKSARAVGNANNKNPLPLFIPCHRVLRANGDLGGFAPGVHFKKKLLKLESQNGMSY
jgi:methylated-DNA-[protein]-cysteine S-methyltransferase